MIKKNTFKFLPFSVSFAFIMLLSVSVFNSCGGNTNKAQEEEANVEDDAFYATQPIHSGFYDADWYDITGRNARKGRFDGRIYFALSPKMSGLYVFENGNRTKIDYVLGLKEPFKKGADGVYSTLDNKDKPVTINTDSTTYFLTFLHSNDTIQIGFNPKPRHIGTALEMLEKMNAQKSKK